MKTWKKAILLSALVLPGLGQITLKRYKTGIAIILVVVVSFYRMMSVALEQANAIVNKAIEQGGGLDIMAISNAASSSDNSTYNLYLWIIIACWVIGIVDAWLAGTKSPES